MKAVFLFANFSLNTVVQEINAKQMRAGADPTSNFRGVAISVIFGSQVSTASLL